MSIHAGGCPGLPGRLVLGDIPHSSAGPGPLFSVTVTICRAPFDPYFRARR